MSMNSILSLGVQGLQAGLGRADQAAERIARVGTGDIDSDSATNIVNLKISEHQVKSAAAVIRTGNEMLGTLIDINA